MSESVKPRFAVDLNEIERQLAHTGGTPPAQPGSASRNDPLAELARIVGQDDPFEAILSNERAARPRQQPSVDDLFATRDTVTRQARAAQPRQPRQAHNAQETAGYDFDPYAQAGGRGHGAAHDYASYPPSQGQQDYADQDYQGYYADSDYAGADYGEPERLDYPPVERRRSRKGAMAIGAVIGAIVIGGAGAYMLGGGSSLTVDGEPPLVQADNAPTKVPPQNPGGVVIPNQNKEIYERSDQSGETKVVNREEQPVDLEQAVRLNGGGDASSSAQAANSLNLGEPRKVRTVTVRPDGTIVGQENRAPANAEPVYAPPMVLPTQAQAGMAQEPAAEQTASAEPKPAASTPAASTPVEAAAPARAPEANPAPQRVASAQPVPLAPQAVEPEPAPAPVPTGDFSVQLGLANSESGAEAAFAKFQQKYSELAGQPLMVRKAELNGNTIYRVRVGPMSRQEASSLCSKLQGQGGECFVAKN